jgi:hypothetical protein
VKVKCQPVYLFNREQLLLALDVHCAGLSQAMAAHTRAAVMAFLDGEAASKGGLLFDRVGSDQNHAE